MGRASVWKHQKLVFLNSGRTVQVVQKKRNRAKIISPVKGWVSITSCYLEDFQILRPLDIENKLNSVDDLTDIFSNIKTPSSAVLEKPTTLKKKKKKFKKWKKKNHRTKKSHTDELML